MQPESPSALMIGKKVLEQYPKKDNFNETDVLLLIVRACSQYYIDLTLYRNSLLNDKEKTELSQLSQIDEP